jgi:beta-lactamase regulating signal transducer with metallopeptidase domain
LTVPTFIDGLVTTLLTYAMHSFAACVLALAISRALGRPQDRELLWKVTLVAPLVTTLVAVGVSTFSARGGFVDLAQLVRHAPNADFPGREVKVRMLYDGSTSSVVRQFTDPVTTVLSRIAIAASLCVICVALIRFAHRRRHLTRAVAQRRAMGELPVAAHGNAVQLSAAADLQSPVALGTSEICLPAEVVDEFTEEHRGSLIAHEIAHLERRDPAWFFAAELIAALSAFQPLVFVVLRAFRRDVELICDEVAVRRTSDQQSLIGALALLASPFDARSPLHGAATAYDGSPLLARAQRIATLSLAAAPSGVRRPALLATLALVALLCAVPVVSAAPRLSDFPTDPVAALRSARRSGRIVTVNEEIQNESRRIIRIVQ